MTSFLRASYISVKLKKETLLREMWFAVIDSDSFLYSGGLRSLENFISIEFGLKLAGALTNCVLLVSFELFTPAGKAEMPDVSILNLIYGLLMESAL